MDSKAITDVIAAAISAGFTSGVTEVGKNVIIDTYTNIKSKLIEKLGKENKVTRAVEELENEPEFKPHEVTLEARIEQSGILQNKELVALFQALQAALNSSATRLKQNNISDNAQVGIIGDYAKIGSQTFTSNK